MELLPLIFLLKHPSKNHRIFLLSRHPSLIFLATKGLLDNVAVSKVRAFEKDFIGVMKATQKSTMDALKAGKYDDSLTDVLTKISKEVAPKYA